MTLTSSNGPGARSAFAAILCAAILTGCGTVGNPLANAGPRQIDLATAGVAACPGLKPMFAASLKDGVIRISEINDLADKARELGDESDRAYSYAEARSVAGLPPVKRPPPCHTSPLMDWVTVL